MTNQPLHYETIENISHLLARGELSAVELTDAMLDRIAAVDPVLGAYAHVDGAGARASAARLDQERAAGTWRGPLHGVPLAVKDIYADAGQPLEVGMPSRIGAVAEETATVVRRLRDAGAVIIGRVHTTEGVYGEHTAPFVAPKNPWGLDRWVGVSSSGSASSTAGGLAFAALGSDTGGSIRMPSSANGATGIKPTWGRCSRFGVFELGATLDHVGPIARSARDAGFVLEAIAGYDVHDPTSLAAPVDPYGARTSTDLSGTRIGLDVDWALGDVSDTVRRGMLEAIDQLEQLGAEFVPVRFPDPEQINEDWFVVCGVQTATAHGSWFDTHEATYGAALHELISIGRSTSGVGYQEVLQRREWFKGQVNHLLSEVDALFIPGLPYEAPLASDTVQMGAQQLAEVHRYTVPFTMSQVPTITFPIGFTEAEGLPVAGQLVGARLTEANLVRIASAFQRVSRFHLKHPAL
ncbi:amidase [Leucobacter sp. Psy1]|uniref:amidase n=1 Tax=Leucobacter sp. Psy1 TaxID=2875729 RepID=UPI001CD7C1C6|nr:amidase [Leucobacter sp. Psy1]UBH04646.1 amidase [Leucobacter sp. Psy1]